MSFVMAPDQTPDWLRESVDGPARLLNGGPSSWANMTGINEATNYALDVRNSGAGGGGRIRGSGTGALRVTSSRVEVDGGLVIGGGLTLSTGNLTVPAGSITASGTITSSAGNLVATVGSVSAGANVSAAANVSAGTSLTVGTSATIGTTLGVTGATTLTGALAANGGTTTTTLTATGNTVMGDANTDTHARVGLTTFRNAAASTVQLYIDAGNNRSQFGSVTPLGSATNSIVEVIGGRAYFAPNSEVVAIGLRYGAAVTGQVYLGAENSTTPDLLISNNAGTQIGRFTNEGLLLTGQQTAAVSTAGDGDVQANDVWLVNTASNFRRLLANGSAFQISNNGNSGTDMTIDSAGLVTIKGLEVDTNGIEVTGGINVLSGGIDIAANSFVVGTNRFEVNGTGVGAFGATPVARPTVVGARAGNVALASLLTALGATGLGWITDSTTA